MRTTDGADSYAAETSALLIGEGPCSDAREALQLAGVKVRTQAGFATAGQHLDELGIDLILVEAANARSDLLDGVITQASAFCQGKHTSILVAMAIDQLDAAANFLDSHTHLLCEPSLSERLAAIALARAAARNHRTPTLHDVSRESESARLQRLNEEVARIAEALARLTRGEDTEQRAGGVRDPGRQYRGPQDVAGAVETSAHEIRAVIRSRRLRAQCFDPELFADPAWDMLLDLFAARLERQLVSVSSLCIAAAVPPTTALRWIGTMHEAGLFERQADPSDRRRAYIGLSPKGLDGMRAYVSAAKRAGLALV